MPVLFLLIPATICRLSRIISMIPQARTWGMGRIHELVNCSYTSNILVFITFNFQIPMKTFPKLLNFICLLFVSIGLKSPRSLILYVEKKK